MGGIAVGLFDDDFYSSKISKWERRRLLQERWPTWYDSRRSLQVLLLTSAVVLIALIIIITILFSGYEEQSPIPQVSPSIQSQQVSIVDIVQKLKPAIVSVISIQEKFALEDEITSIGSGIIYYKKGSVAKVVTNYHVVEAADSIEVVLANGERLNAELIGSDLLTDLAVLKIEAQKVESIAEFGNSDVLREGEAVIAIGHPFGLGYSPTFTLGIISSLERIIPISLGMDGTTDWEMKLLQTDAAINQGNSGGALVNMEGKVIGINSMKVAQSGVEGLGFAIPSNDALLNINELEDYGKVRRPYLGVATVDLKTYNQSEDFSEIITLPEEVQAGIIVLEALGPAAAAGIQPNDVIITLDGKMMTSTLDLRKYLYINKKISDPLRVEFYRNGEKYIVDLILTEAPGK
jgi:serine protease Do